MNGTKGIVWRGASKEEILESAEKWGKKWSDIENSRRERRVSSTQIRRYYSEVKRLELLINQEGWDKHALTFKLLKAKAAYALRTERQKRQSMVDFIQVCIDKVKSKEDFDYFVLYFEAALGFAYGFGLSD